MLGGLIISPRLPVPVTGNANASYAGSNLELVNKVEGDALGSCELSALFVILLRLFVSLKAAHVSLDFID